MRAMAVLLLGLVIFTASTAAGQTTRVPLLNGVYSVAAPTDWEVEQTPDGGMATFYPAKGSTKSVMFLAPNPMGEGEIAEYAGIIMGSMFKALGGGAVTGETELEFKGNSSVVFHFAIPADGSGIQGIAHVIDFDGYAALAIAMAPAAELEALWELAGPMFDSYEFNSELAEENAEILNDIVENLVKEFATIKKPRAKTPAAVKLPKAKAGKAKAGKAKAGKAKAGKAKAGKAKAGKGRPAGVKKGRSAKAGSAAASSSVTTETTIETSETIIEEYSEERATEADQADTEADDADDNGDSDASADDDSGDDGDDSDDGDDDDGDDSGDDDSDDGDDDSDDDDSDDGDDDSGDDDDGDGDDSGDGGDDDGGDDDGGGDDE